MDLSILKQTSLDNSFHINLITLLQKNKFLLEKTQKKINFYAHSYANMLYVNSI